MSEKIEMHEIRKLFVSIETLAVSPAQASGILKNWWCDEYNS